MNNLNRGVADFYALVQAGRWGQYSIVHKFGRNAAVGTTFVPITIGGDWQTPQPAAATALRVKAGNATDTAAGDGAREVTVEGIDSTGAFASEALATNGASAGTAGSVSFMRLNRVFVSKSGRYASQSLGSHAADIVIENSAGGTDWATIASAGFPRGQSEIGAYTVPSGFTALLVSAFVSVDSTKSADLLFFQRQGVTKAAAPYDAMRVVFEMGGVSGEEVWDARAPIKFPAGTDLGFMAKVSSGTAEVDVDFEMLLIED